MLKYVGFYLGGILICKETFRISITFQKLTAEFLCGWKMCSPAMREKQYIRRVWVIQNNITVLPEWHENPAVTCPGVWCLLHDSERVVVVATFSSIDEVREHDLLLSNMHVLAHILYNSPSGGTAIYRLLCSSSVSWSEQHWTTSCAIQAVLIRLSWQPFYCHIQGNPNKLSEDMCISESQYMLSHISWQIIIVISCKIALKMWWYPKRQTKEWHSEEDFGVTREALENETVFWE